MGLSSFFFLQYQWCSPATQEDITAVPSAPDQQRCLRTSQQSHYYDAANRRAFHNLGVSMKNQVTWPCKINCSHMGPAE